MRIIAGAARGVSLNAPDHHTRPTSDRVREAIFSVLAHVTVNAQVLDLFAGSGALGLEALSRGARQATFLENNSHAVSIIKNNIRRTQLTNAKVIPRDAIKFTRETTSKFDLIFADPPYARGSHDWTADLTSIPMLPLAPSGILTLEVEGERSTPEFPRLTFLKRKNYGKTSVIYYQNPS